MDLFLERDEDLGVAREAVLVDKKGLDLFAVVVDGLAVGRAVMVRESFLLGLFFEGLFNDDMGGLFDKGILNNHLKGC